MKQIGIFEKNLKKMFENARHNSKIESEFKSHSSNFPPRPQSCIMINFLPDSEWLASDSSCSARSGTKFGAWGFCFLAGFHCRQYAHRKAVTVP